MRTLLLRKMNGVFLALEGHPGALHVIRTVGFEKLVTILRYVDRTRTS